MLESQGSGYMSFVSAIIGAAAKVLRPDVIVGAAIRLCTRAIAEHTDAASAHHYEVPTA